MTWTTWEMEGGSRAKTIVQHAEVTLGGRTVKMLFPLDQKDSRGIIKIDEVETKPGKVRRGTNKRRSPKKPGSGGT
jgi:hypothetical protein